jgi:hypothetical protein
MRGNAGGRKVCNYNKKDRKGSFEKIIIEET